MDEFKVTLGICTHSKVDIRCWATMWSLGKCPNPKISPYIQPGDALISRSRNKLATHFLKNTDDEMLMFLDDDIEISAFDATRMMWEVHTNKYPILGAVYALKDPEKGGFAFMAKEDKGQILMGKEGKIESSRRVSTGCMIIRREVFETMIEKETAHFCKQGYYSFFQHREMLIDGVWDDGSEDWWFCKKALDLGVGVFVDPRPKTNHWGVFPYNWDFVNMNGQFKKYDSLNFSYDVKKQ